MSALPPSGSRPHAVSGPRRTRAPLARLAEREPRRSARPRLALSLRLVRYGLPGVTIAAGLVSMAIGTTASLAGGGALVGAGLAIALSSWLYRYGAAGDRERAAEERARRYFERHGRWPG